MHPKNICLILLYLSLISFSLPLGRNFNNPILQHDDIQ